MSNVRFTLAHANAANETSEVAHWFVPRSHFLESWGDARAFDGTATIVQPLIAPLHESLSEIELLAILCEDEPSGYASVRKTWKAILGERDDDSRWQQAIANGIIPNTATPAAEVSLQPAAAIQRSVDQATKGLKGIIAEGRIDLVFKPDPTIWDGRFINNGWLQELPKPLTHTVWDNAAWIAPSDAKRLQLTNGDMVSLGEKDDKVGAIEIPVWIVPGHATGCITYSRVMVAELSVGLVRERALISARSSSRMRQLSECRSPFTRLSVIIRS